MKFSKYHGAGNDFILLDGFQEEYNLSAEYVQLLCHRNLGIGSDGLIVINASEEADFEMKFYNPDGSTGMLCGNGARCAVMFAASLGYVGDEMTFKAADGIHHGLLHDDNTVSITIQAVDKIEKVSGNYFLNTGTAHLVVLLKEGLDNYDVYTNGKKLREDKRFEPVGTNVNFIERKSPENYDIRTFEKGVENETLACGTGVVAAALAAHYAAGGVQGTYTYTINARISSLQVSFQSAPHGVFKDIWLKGPVKHVFSGLLEDGLAFRL